MRSTASFLFICFVFLSSSCDRCKSDPPRLDFSTDTYYTVSELLESCRIDNCNQTGYWEGQTIRAKGQVDYPSIQPTYFFLRNGESLGIRVNITGDAQAIRDSLGAHPGKTCKIVALGAGENHPKNYSCERVIALELSKATDLGFE